MANLPLQELLNKYRAEEKAAAQETPADPEQTNAELAMKLAGGVKNTLSDDVIVQSSTV